MKKRYAVSIVVVAVLYGGSMSAMAAQGKGLQLSPSLTLEPGLTVKIESNDNIYLDNGTTEVEYDDTTTKVSPKLTLTHRYSGKRGSLAAGYSGDFVYFSDYGENDTIGHKLFLKNNYTAPGGMSLKFDISTSDLEDPFSSRSDSIVAAAVKSKRTENQARFTGGYKSSESLKSNLYLNHFNQDYDKVEDFDKDYSETEFGIGASVRVMPKTWAFVRYHNGSRDYDGTDSLGLVNGTNDADLTWDRINAGLSWDSDAKFSGEFNVGYKWVDYDNALDSDGNAYENESAVIATTNVNYKMSETTTIIAGITADTDQSGEAGLNENAESMMYKLGLSKALSNKIRLKGDISTENKDYNNNVDNRSDDTVKLNAVVEYKINDYLVAAAGYSYADKDSNVDTNDYTNNKFYLSLKGKL